MQMVAFADDPHLIQSRPYLARQPAVPNQTFVSFRLRVNMPNAGVVRTFPRDFAIADAIPEALRALKAPHISPDEACGQFMRSITAQPWDDFHTQPMARPEFGLRDLPSAAEAHARAAERLERGRARTEIMKLPTVRIDELSPVMRSALFGDGVRWSAA